MNIEDINVDKELRIVFMGTPDFAVPVLQGLIDNYNVKAVVTQPDKPVGRHGEISMSPIKKLALDNTILVLQPKSLKEEWQDVMSLHPDMIVTCAYGQLVPRELLVYPKYGCIATTANVPIKHTIIPTLININAFDICSGCNLLSNALLFLPIEKW